MSAIELVKRSEDNLQESVPAFWHMGPGHWTQVPRLGAKYIYLMSQFFMPCGKYFTGDLLSHLTIPIIVYLDYFQIFYDCKHRCDKHLWI